jgi:CHAT domain-containing protein/tetratricopeptide (TPR) repeat protein
MRTIKNKKTSTFLPFAFCLSPFDFLVIFLLSSLLPITPLTEGFPPGPSRQSTQELGGAKTERDVIEPGRPIDRALAGGQQHSYQINLSADQFVKAVVKQDGIDVAVKLFEPDGKQITEFDSEFRTQGEETFSLVAKAAGNYRIDVLAKYKNAAAGQYEIQILELRAATESDHALLEAGKLNSEFLRLTRAGKYDEARPLAERMLEIHERVLGLKHPVVAADLNNLASIHSIKGDYAKAERIAQRALTIRETALGPEHSDIAATLNLLAIIYKNKGEYAKAEPLYLRALTIRETALGPEHTDIASFLNNIGNFYHEIGNDRKAEPFLQRALTIQEKALGPEHIGIATTLNNLGNIYYALGDSAKAAPLYARSLAIREKLLGPEHPDVATSLSNLANIDGRRDDPIRAEQLYQRALSIREKALGPEHPLVARSLINLSVIYKIRGDYAKAEPFLQRALAIQEKALGPEHPSVGSALSDIADLYYELGDYARAEPIYHRALGIQEKGLGPEHRKVALSLNNLANLYNNRGDYLKAEMFYRRALTIWEQILAPERPMIAKIQSNLAIVYKRRGDYAQAESLYQGALTIQEKLLGPEHTDIGYTLNNIAALYIDRGEHAKAEPLLNRALTIQEKGLGMEHPQTARYLANLATVYNDRGDYARAEQVAQRALTIREKALGPEHPAVADSLKELANFYRKRGDYVKSEPLYRRALAIWERSQGPEHPDVAVALNGLAMLYALKSDIPQAVTYLSRATAVDERNLALNLAIGSERQKLAYLSLFSKRTDFTLWLHNLAAPNDPQALNLAFTTLLRRKGRGLDAMTDTIATLRRHATQQDQELFDDLTVARSQLAALKLKGPDEANPERYRTLLETLEAAVENLEVKLSARSAEFRAQAQPVTLAAVQSALPAAGALIEFVVYTPQEPQTGKSRPPRYLAYLLAPQGPPRWVDLGEAASIDRAVGAWRLALRGNRVDAKHLARELDEKVMRPVRSLLQPGQPGLGEIDRLLIAPDGSLNLIPFAALVDEENRYLIERYTISYLTSGRDLLRLQNSPPPNQNAPLVMANPLFGSVAAATASGARRSGRNSPRGKRQREQIVFRPLPGTKAEALAIKAILPEASLLLQQEATEAALKRARAPRILHIATHGFFLVDQETDPAETGGATGDDILPIPELRLSKWAAHFEEPLLRSGLALSGANRGRSGDDDGVLTALEVAGLDLSGTRLVVLSACDTGLGEVKNGEGVQGLRRALVLAGSESQVMSLWPVSDKGAKELMIEYYKALQRGEGRSEGLRQVQLRMLRSKQWLHPFYWAAFIQSGEWANLESQR